MVVEVIPITILVLGKKLNKRNLQFNCIICNQKKLSCNCYLIAFVSLKRMSVLFNM